MARYVTSVLLLVGLCGPALAQGPHNVIYQHNSFYNDPNSPGFPFYGVEQDRLIYIYHGVEGQVFEFEAVVEVNGQYVGPGDINKIESWGSAENVVVTFVGHNGHPYGAANIKEVYLRAQNFTGVIQDLNISGDLGELGPIIADAAGSITVGGSLVNALGIWTDVTGSLTVGGDVVGDIEVEGAITGPVTIGGNLCAYQWGTTLTSESLGSLAVGGACIA